MAKRIKVRPVAKPDPTGTADRRVVVRFLALLTLDRVEEALGRADALALVAGSPDQVAATYLMLGVQAERMERFDVAAEVYRRGLIDGVNDRGVAYFTRNNLGYSLNMAESHREAEAWCRAAIAVDPARHNAWKNLGVSLEGQGTYGAAAQAYCTATVKYPADRRALELLRALVERERAAVLASIPDIDRRLTGLAELE